MSESVLKALVRLFALIGDIHDDTVITGREKAVVRKFLLRHLSNEQVDKYMEMFDEFLSLYNSENIAKGSLRDRKRISLNSVRILSICEEINSELARDQKIYVIVKLADFLLGSDITETELEFLETVSESFNIPAEEFHGVKTFIMGSTDEMIGNSDLLIADNGRGEDKGFIHHIVNKNLEGTIMFLNVRSTNTWLMRYAGDKELYLNGQNVRAGETYIFDKGSSIRGSGINAIYYAEVAGYISSAASGTTVTLTADSVNYRFRGSKNGLHDFNFFGKTGELIGIIGGSGVGKSTALSILSGTLKPQGGKVLINGYDLYDRADHEKLRGVVGFVPQDDLLIEELSVYQNLYYNARMCLGNLSETRLTEAVSRIITDLDLDPIRDLQVGNPLNKVISGGQRKRVNIALELMREPTVLFVDEPTSGLSSLDSEMVVGLLKDLTFRGKLVIANIHQPSSEIYKMFDKIIIIDRGGYQVYHGNPSEAIVYFRVNTNHANPYEDHCSRCGNVDTEQLLQILESRVLDEHGRPTRTRKISPSEWAEKFKTFFSRTDLPDQPEKKDLPRNRFSIPGRSVQTLIFFTRDVLAKMANKQYLLISFLGPPALALLLSYFIRTSSGSYYLFGLNDNIPAYLFMCVITSMFFGLMVSSEEIINDRKILRRESFLNLSWFSYINSKVVIMFILSAVQTLSFVVAGSLILKIKGMMVSHWLVLFSTSCFANLLGLNLSAAFRSVITIYILIPFIIIPQMLFSGVIVRFHKLNARVTEYVPVVGEAMMARWAFEAIAVRQFSGNEYSKLFFNQEAEVSRYARYGYLVEALLMNVNFIARNVSNPGSSDAVQNSFRKLDRYTAELASLTGAEFRQGLRDSLSPGIFNEQSFRQYLTNLKGRIELERRKAQNSLDLAKKSVIDSIGTDSLVKVMNMYDNQMLRYELLNKNDLVKVQETGNKIVLRYQTGYMKGTSKTGRAHFYAPSKTIGNIEAGTFTFNLIFIWLNTLLLYLILYFRLAEKAVSWLAGERSGRE